MKKGARTARKTSPKKKTKKAPAKAKKRVTKAKVSRKVSKKQAKPIVPVVLAKKRVIVTGGTGFVGHHICHELAAKGYHVIILTQGVSKQEGHDNETTVHWDGKDYQTLLPYLDGAYAVLNLAGESFFGRWNAAKKKEILDSRLRVGKALLQAIQAIDKKPVVFIQASTVAYYGSSADVLDENASMGKGFLAGVASEWERSTSEVELLRIRHIIARFGIVLGKAGGAFPRMLEPFRNLLGGTTASGNQHFSFVHETDCIRALVFLIENESAHGIYNVVAPKTCTNREFTHAVSKFARLPMLFGESSVIARLVYGEVAKETVLANQIVLPKRLEQAGFTFQYPSVESAVEELLK